MPRQEGMDGGYPLAGSPQAGRGRNMQQHGRGGLLPARCRGGMELLWLPLCAGQGRLPAQQPSKQRRPTAMPGTSLQILVRETGLEPVWINRWILSPVRLPIPPLSPVGTQRRDSTAKSQKSQVPSCSGGVRWYGREPPLRPHTPSASCRAWRRRCRGRRQRPSFRACRPRSGGRRPEWRCVPDRGAG